MSLSEYELVAARSTCTILAGSTMTSEATPRAALAVFLIAIVTACGESADVRTAKPPVSYPLDDVLRLNHMQVKGTHNSYHLKPQEQTIPKPPSPS